MTEPRSEVRSFGKAHVVRSDPNERKYLVDVDFAAGVSISNVDEALFRRLTDGERGRNGHLLWLREDGERR